MAVYKHFLLRLGLVALPLAKGETPLDTPINFPSSDDKNQADKTEQREKK